ncbi:folate transporter 1 isoform X2 [Wolffia australiana]
MGASDPGPSTRWEWQNALAGAVAGFTTVATLHPLDVVRTRFQVNDGRLANVPCYKNTGHALYSIGRSEGLRGLYSGFCPAVIGSTVSWGLYFLLYNKIKQRYSRGSGKDLNPGHHLLSAAEAGAWVCLFTNPIWLVKTRLQIQTPLLQTRPYTGFYDALRTILKDEGFRAFYKGLGPSLMLVSHGAIQFTVYEELRKLSIHIKSHRGITSQCGDKGLNTFDHAVLGASSKMFAIMFSYPYQQRPRIDGSATYSGSWHVVKETYRFEGLRGFYKGITSSLLKNAPAASITFVVYENTRKLIGLPSSER